MYNTSLYQTWLGLLRSCVVERTDRRRRGRGEKKACWWTNRYIIYFSSFLASGLNAVFQSVEPAVLSSSLLAAGMSLFHHFPPFFPLRVRWKSPKSRVRNPPLLLSSLLKQKTCCSSSCKMVSRPFPLHIPSSLHLSQPLSLNRNAEGMSPYLYISSPRCKTRQNRSLYMFGFPRCWCAGTQKKKTENLDNGR